MSTGESETCVRKFFDETVRRASTCCRFFVFGSVRRDGKMVPSCLCCFWHCIGSCSAVDQIVTDMQARGEARRAVLALTVQKKEMPCAS